MSYRMTTCMTHHPGAGEELDTPVRPVSTIKESPKPSPVVICLLSSDSEDADDDDDHLEDAESDDDDTEDSEDHDDEIL